MQSPTLPLAELYNDEDSSNDGMNDILSLDFDEASPPSCLQDLTGTQPKPSTVATQSPPNPTSYMSKKPTWWKRCSGKPTKGQRRVMHQLRERYSIVKPMYGSYLSWDTIFSTTTTTASDDDLEIWLEIGFGLGDNLLYLSAAAASTDCCNTTAITKQQQQHQQVSNRRRRRCFVGAEIHTAGIAILYTRIQAAIDAGTYWNGYTLFTTPTTTTTTTSSSLHSCTDPPNSLHNNDDEDDDNTIGKNEIPSRIISSNGTTNDSNVSSNNNSNDEFYTNLRIYPGDGTKLLPHIPSGSVSVVLITFPDPFMGGSHEEPWRILQLSVLAEIRRILHGRLYLATDHSGYHDWCHNQIHAFNQKQCFLPSSSNDGGINPPNSVASIPTHPSRQQQLFTLVEPTPDRNLWLPVISKYEQKGWDEGRWTHLSCWE